jgi:hydroxyacylglutathione hydrolase
LLPTEAHTLPHKQFIWVELINDTIFCVKNLLFPSNTYVLKSKLDNNCIIIDPGLSPELINEKIKSLNLKPLAIICTHGHFDHIASVHFFKEQYGIPFYLHEADLKLSQSANFYLKLTKIDAKITTLQPDFLFRGQSQHLAIQDFHFNVFNFPGHSPGSCIFQLDNYLFSGDIIYKYGLGFNNFPGENKNILKVSILEIFNCFPENSIILPGHGEKDTLQNIKNLNTELKNFVTL